MAKNSSWRSSICLSYDKICIKYVITEIIKFGSVFNWIWKLLCKTSRLGLIETRFTWRHLPWQIAVFGWQTCVCARHQSWNLATGVKLVNWNSLFNASTVCTVYVNCISKNHKRQNIYQNSFIETSIGRLWGALTNIFWSKSDPVKRSFLN